MPRPLRPPVLAVTDGASDAVRAHILDAARRVMADKGLASASTRAIADEAGVAGGTLYNYFDGHADLVAKCIVQHARNLMGPVSGLQGRAGNGSVAQNLRWFVRQAATVLDQLVPAFAAAFSDPALLTAVQREMASGDVADDPTKVLEQYLRAERDLGRLSADADCRAAASILVSLCHQDAFDRHLHGAGGKPKTRAREIELITRGLTGPAGPTEGLTTRVSSSSR